MKKSSPSTKAGQSKSATAKAGKPIGARAFAAISAVEGLRLGQSSKRRPKALKADRTLSPEERRAEVLRAYMDLARKDEP